MRHESKTVVRHVTLGRLVNSYRRLKECWALIFSPPPKKRERERGVTILQTFDYYLPNYTA